jgi:hypothetical protein
MLLDEAQNVRARLTRVEAASSGVEEANALATRRDELNTLVLQIMKLASRYTLLRAEGIPLTPISNIDTAKQVTTQIRDRFVESPKVSTLTNGKRWTRLVTTLNELKDSAEILQRQDWKNYFNSKLFGGVPPEQRRQTILPALPENRKALERYTKLYQSLNQYRNTVPGTVEALHEVHACSKDLADIKFVENDDVPTSVKAFFNATSTGNGANLDFLTPEVIEWLRTNNMLANYVVRAR